MAHKAHRQYEMDARPWHSDVFNYCEINRDLLREYPLTPEESLQKPKTMKTTIYTVAVRQEYEEKGKKKTKIVLDPIQVTARSKHEAILKAAGEATVAFENEEEYDVLVQELFNA